MLSDPERYGKSYVQRLAASMAVPAIASQVAQSIDPNMRDARTIMDAIKARVPVLSKSVPVRRNIWGDPIDRGNALGPDIISPFYARTASKSPLAQEVARLRVPLSMPQRYVRIGGKKVDLTAQQYDELVQLSGQPARKYLESEIATPVWKQMRDDERTEAVKDALKQFREAGALILMRAMCEVAQWRTRRTTQLLPSLTPL